MCENENVVAIEELRESEPDELPEWLQTVNKDEMSQEIENARSLGEIFAVVYRNVFDYDMPERFFSRLMDKPFDEMNEEEAAEVEAFKDACLGAFEKMFG